VDNLEVNDINVYLCRRLKKVNDMKCPNCEKEIVQTKGKRKRLFCNSTCRSNVWQKEKRKQPKKDAKPKETDSKTSTVPEIEQRIAKIKEMLKLPPKYLPPIKKSALESELYLLELKLTNQNPTT